MVLFIILPAVSTVFVTVLPAVSMVFVTVLPAVSTVFSNSSPAEPTELLITLPAESSVEVTTLPVVSSVFVTVLPAASTDFAKTSPAASTDLPTTSPALSKPDSPVCFQSLEVVFVTPAALYKSSDVYFLPLQSIISPFALMDKVQPDSGHFGHAGHTGGIISVFNIYFGSEQYPSFEVDDELVLGAEFSLLPFVRSSNKRLITFTYPSLSEPVSIVKLILSSIFWSIVGFDN